MEGGYVLAHVLEVVVPGQDLGDTPLCEIALGDASVSCPVPSTLQSENVALPTGGDAEPVVHVRAYDSRHESVGLVVVPVSTLVPLEVWNVWYAMDEGVEELDEKPPEETPKMHLLLQYVSCEAAADETAQLREMRAQDFLLRALQQLNASLEAKVMVHQGRTSQGGSPQGESPVSAVFPAASGDSGYSAAFPAASGDSGYPSAVGSSASLAPNGLPPMSGSEAPAPPRSTGMRSMPSTSALPPATATPSSPSRLPTQQVQGGSHLHPPQTQAPLHQENVEAYVRHIATLEEKVRHHESQHAGHKEVARQLEEQNHALQAKLDHHILRCQNEVEKEQNEAQQARHGRQALDQSIVELQQEVSLRKAHEDSLQRRLALLENELSVVHQRCSIVDSVEDEARSLRKELEAERELRRQQQEQVEAAGKKASQAQEELCQLREVSARELEKARLVASEHDRLVLAARRESDELADQARDKVAEAALATERVTEMTRQIGTLDGEISSYKTMLDRERQHRRELERRLEEQELRKIHAVVDEHSKALKDARAMEGQLHKDLDEERGRAGGLATELASVQRELVRAQRQVEEFRHRLGAQDDLREEAGLLRERNEELRSQARQVQQEMRKAAEHYEHQLGEHSRSMQELTQDRDNRAKELADLHVWHTQAATHRDELLKQQDQASRALATAKETSSRCQELHRHLESTKEELRGHSQARDGLSGELERRSAQTSELEAMLEDRNNEIKLLMYRVQELSSKYVPVRGDNIDVVLAKWVNGYRPAVPFFRLAQGHYLFGKRQVMCKISNDKPVFRVGGGFIGFDKFLELYASEELERLLSYEMDPRTGEPKFIESQRSLQDMDQQGVLDDLRDRAERSQAARGTSPSGHSNGGSSTRLGSQGVLADRRRSLNSSAMH